MHFRSSTIPATLSRVSMTGGGPRMGWVGPAGTILWYLWLDRFFSNWSSTGLMPKVKRQVNPLQPCLMLLRWF